MALIFISYKAQDTRHAARLVTDRLRAYFGQTSVFLDNTSIPLGAEFPPTIVNELREARVLIAVIGPRWLTAPNMSGSNIADPGDWVRRELNEAIRDRKLIVPILVDGMSMPRKEELPPDLRPLTERQFLSIGDRTLDHEIHLLAQRLRTKFPELSSRYRQPPVESHETHGPAQLVTDRQRSRRRVLHITAGVVVFVAIAVSVLVILMTGDTPDGRLGSAAGAAQPFMERDGYVLRTSSLITTNDQDKVDIDTGCPGWGNMSPSFGPSRCGEQADVIIDEEGIHTADGGPHLYQLASNGSASFDSCIAAFDTEPDSGVNQIDAADLNVDDQICVRTDKRNVALVRIDGVTTDAFGQLTELIINFTAWKS